MNKENRKLLLIVLAACGWFALISQLYLSVTNSRLSVAETILNFFSYFTIQVNILVAITSTALFNNGMNARREQTIAGAAVYILIVGITYNLLLRNVWNPQGLQKVVDELLHTVIPILFAVLWFVYAPKKSLRWKNAILFMIYPVVYAAYTLAHGLISNWYPYPFIDPNNVGWNSVAINSVFVILAFLAVSLLIIGIGKIRSRPV